MVGESVIQQVEPRSGGLAAVVATVLSLLIADVLVAAGSGTLSTILSVRLAGVASPVAIGVVIAAFYAGLCAGSILFPPLISRIGQIRAFSAFAALIAGASLGHALAVDPWLWAALRLIEGFCMAALFICIESWLNQRATGQTRGQVLALYMICHHSGEGLGQLLIDIPDAHGFTLFATISILLSFAVIPVALTHAAPPSPVESVRFSLREAVVASPLGTFGVLVSGLLLGSLYGLLPVYAQQVGRSTSETALLMIAMIMGGGLLQWPIGRISDRHDRRRLLLMLYAGLTVISVLVPVSAILGLPVLLVGIVVFGGGLFAIYPVSVAHTADHLRPEQLVAASGNFILVYSVGATLGPLGASAAMMGGPTGLFVFTGLVSAGAAAFALWRLHGPKTGSTGQAPALLPAPQGRVGVPPRDLPSSG
ncbi:MAG: MFS transporter [Azospirillaceae bacterium]|nr:MFS transporter [Azospirillaceae bacterium]